MVKQKIQDDIEYRPSSGVGSVLFKRASSHGSIDSRFHSKMKNQPKVRSFKHHNNG
jgi:hypothetical protein